ncbi:subunit of TIM23 translocase complex [Blastocladiella emersonii ATCC 22665]|nr:subunit of TIM23 translocase complex [Blastocladiella emersonii ATCC 22665]
MNMQQPQGPTLADKLKMGAMMGGGVGLGLGFIMGNIQYLIYGARGKGYLGTLSNAMMTSGASFGFFMAIGTVIRSEGAALPAPRAELSPAAAVRRMAPPVSAEARAAFASFAQFDLERASRQ